MKRKISRLTLLAASVGVLVLHGCGGGSSSTSFTLSGVAATGAAFDGASVTATDAAGMATSCGTTTTSGTYTCSLPSTAAAPIVIEAIRGIEAYYSVTPEAKSSTVNVTPLTSAIVATLSPTGDPSEFKNEVKADKTLAAAEKVQSKINLLKEKLAAVLSATLGADANFDPLAGSFTAGSGTGMDKVLDAIKVSYVAKTGDASPAKLTIALRADPETSLTIKKGDEDQATPISPEAVAAIQSTLDLKPAAMIAELVEKMNACYALPAADRVRQTGSNGSASDVNPTCAAIFAGGDPTSFKSGGNLVSGSGAFSTLFSTSVQSVVFDQVSFEFAKNTTDWVLSYRATSAGTSTFGTWVTRQESQNGQTVLRQIGNQFNYDTSVSPFVQDRDYIQTPKYSHLDTGYSLSVPNKTINGQAIYAKVDVVSPNGSSFTLKPTSGSSYLGVVQNPGQSNEKITGSNVIRLSYAYKNAPPTLDVPELETGLNYAPNKWTDAEISEIPEQGVWTFNIYLASDPSNPIEQKVRTVTRARTLAEAQKLQFVNLTATAKAELTSRTAVLGSILVDQSMQGGITIGTGSDGKGDAWEVPVGAIAPTTIRVYGSAPYAGSSWGAGFDDSTSVSPAARTAIIKCSTQTAGDAHCSNGQFAIGTRINQLQMTANAPRGVTLSKHINTYYPTNGDTPAPISAMSGPYTLTVGTGMDAFSIPITVTSHGIFSNVPGFDTALTGYSVTKNSDGTVNFNVSYTGLDLQGTVNSTGSVSGTVVYKGAGAATYSFVGSKDSS